MGFGQFYDGTYPLGDARVYEGADTGWPPPDAQPQDWLYTIGRASLGQPVVREGGVNWAEEAPGDPATPWLYTIGGLGRRSKRLRGLGDDTPDAIRIYVPRLAAGLYAIDLYESGLTKDQMPPAEPVESARWNDRIATKFSQEAKRYLHFVPVVHEPAGADVIFAHMLGATSHASAERIWTPLQTALNRARAATGVAAPADPYAGTPRAYETGAPTEPEAVAPPAPVVRPKSGLDIILGIAMVVGGIVLF